MVDGKRFQEHLVEWMEFGERQLQSIRAHCWNAASGCDFLGPLMTLPEHYYGNCEFHTVICPSCKATVLRSDIVSHKEDGCSSAFVVETLSGNQSPTGQILEITNSLEKISREHATLRTGINEVLKKVQEECSSLKESLRTEVAKLNEAHVEVLGGILSKQEAFLAEVKNCLGDSRGMNYTPSADGGAALTKGQAPEIVRCFQHLNALHWYLDNWNGLKATAMAVGFARAANAATYLHGYNVVCFVMIKRIGDQLLFGSFFKVVKGKWDSKLEWPLKKVFKFRVIHPTDSSKTITDTVDTSNLPAWLEVERPSEAPAAGNGREQLSRVEELDNGGFVVENSLHLSLEFEP